MAAPQFTVNAQRFDPYKNFKFRIKWDGKYVAGMSKASALKRSTEIVTHREGGDPSTSRLTPSVWKFEPITLERGVTHDPEFENWANLIYSTDGDAAISLDKFRKDIIIELLNEQGTVAKSYKVYRCWVSEYQACRSWMPTRTLWPLSTSCCRTKAGNATRRFRNRNKHK